MIFETKFSLNERAWYMNNNKPVEVVISAIQIFEVGTNQSHIKYNGKNVVDSVSWLDHQNLFERMLFKTKDGLLKSLFGDDILCKGENCNAKNGIGHSRECIA